MTRIAISVLLLVLFSCRSDHTTSSDTLIAFLDEFYSGRAQSSMAAVVDKFTEWPEFAVGSTVQIATARDIRLLTERGEEATFEVRYKVIGEESLGKVQAGDSEVVQSYRLRRRRGRWRILEPISIPCISVAGEVARLGTAIEKASDETLVSNAKASILLLDRYRELKE